MIEDIRNYSNERGHTCIHRSFFGWYIVDVHVRNRLGTISYTPTKRSRHLTLKGAYREYAQWCGYLDGIFPPEHPNCRCI